ncbi:gamma-glutamylcyclotransferase family protein [Mangrovicoccus algicola]|uniref:Gamma-glutamylcyclotransferase n=1 Tax=Mangrovicoccus algicola TaxID=2771008 RepID=A0A8J6YYV9_9RHOB|nr:gamma-glutamylcyclotransferase family protein [Mangrovicoccus algicola]MBE3638586.1 gamma-glutamylcyclotransferase [Mangrovicoccus algicola]
MPGLTGIDLVFVYGTLRPAVAHAAAARHLLREAQVLGPATVAGRLYLLSWYPGLVAARAAGDQVRGDLLALPAGSSLLKALDAYEGYDPAVPAASPFRRECREVTGPQGRVAAWLYAWHGPLEGARRIPSGDFISWEG